MSTIDFVSDVICPWCFIGLRHLEQALAKEPDDRPRPTFVFHPFQLDPTTPPEGADLRERIAKKYGADPATMFARVESVARAAGIPLDFSKIQRTPNTLKAHALIGAASSPAQQYALVTALFEAYFLEGRDIGERDVLLELATKHGFDPSVAASALDDPAAVAAVRQTTRELSSQGIGGVPFIIFDQRLAVSGAQPVAVFQRALEEARRLSA